jgi:hypothetical protein
MDDGVSKGRSRYAKGMSSDDVEKYYQRDALIPTSVHERKFTIDNITLSPRETAMRIVQHYRKGPESSVLLSQR